LFTEKLLLQGTLSIPKKLFCHVFILSTYAI
jgi:hypothetical protein